MRCTECGTVASDTDVFCGHCGALLRSSEARRPRTLTPLEPVARDEPEDPGGSPDDPPASLVDRLRTSVPRVLATTIAVVLVAALAVAAPRLADRATAGDLPAPTGERWRTALGTEPSFRFMNLGTGVDRFIDLAAGEDGAYTASAGMVAAYDGATGDRRWQRVLPRPTQPVVVGPVVVVETAQGVVALDRRNGQLRWQDPIADVDRVTTDGRDRIYLSRSRDLTAVEPTEGAILWSVPTFPEPSPAVVAADPDTVVLATTGNAVIRALDAETGRTRWERRASGEVLTAPQLADGRVYVQTGDGSLLALDASTGEVAWSHTSVADEWGPMAAGDGVVVRRTIAGLHVAFDGRDGRQLWTGSRRTFRASIVQDGMVLLPERGSRRIRALDARTGAERWRNDDLAPRELVAHGDALYLDGGGVIVALDVTDGSERWRLEPSDPTDPPAYPTPTVDGDHLYVTTVGGPLVALDRLTGEERWRFDPATAEDELPTDNRTGITSVAFPFAGRVIVTSNRAVYALDAGTGTIADRFQTSVGPGAVPVVTRGMVIVDLGPSVIGLEAASFRLRWQWTAPADGARIGSHPVTAPTVYGDVVLVGGGDGTLAALDPLTGTTVWDLDLGPAVVSQPVVSDDTIVLRTETGDIRAFDARSGRARWRQGLSPTALGEPAVHARTVYATDAGEVISLDLATGTERWRTDLEDQQLTSPVAVGDAILFGTGGVDIVALDGAAGAVLWMHHLTAGIPAPPVVTDEGLVVVTADGTVVSLR